MVILDPNQPLPADAPVWTPSGAVPPHVRTAGRFFNTANWWPGDVLLFRHATPTFFQKQIQSFQTRGGYSVEDACWTHAAIYMGEGLSVCEATIPGWQVWDGKVTVSELYKYVGSHHVRVCRSADVVDREMGWNIVVHALRQLGKPYDLQRIADFARSMFRQRGFWSFDIGERVSRHALICSTLYADAYNAVTGRTMGEKTNGICVPAFLSQCHGLKDVCPQWARLVPAAVQPTHS